MMKIRKLMHINLDISVSVNVHVLKLGVYGVMHLKISRIHMTIRPTPKIII